jgi:hypothetical protein
MGGSAPRGAPSLPRNCWERGTLEKVSNSLHSKHIRPDSESSSSSGCTAAKQRNQPNHSVQATALPASARASLPLPAAPDAQRSLHCRAEWPTSTSGPTWAGFRPTLVPATSRMERFGDRFYRPRPPRTSDSSSDYAHRRRLRARAPLWFRISAAGSRYVEAFEEQR